MVVIPDRALAYWRTHEQLRFLVVGAWNTVVGYLAFVVAYLLLRDRLNYLVIGLVANALAIVNAFAAHRLLTFRSRGRWLPELVRFTIAQLVVTACGLMALALLVSVIGLAPLVAQAIITVAAVVASYLLHRQFSFA